MWVLKKFLEPDNIEYLDLLIYDQSSWEEDHRSKSSKNFVQREENASCHITFLAEVLLLLIYALERVAAAQFNV